MAGAYRCFHCQRLIPARVNHNCGRLIGVAVVQVKKISGKMSWTTHQSYAAADREHNTGHPSVMRYRVNVYRKPVDLPRG